MIEEVCDCLQDAAKSEALVTGNQKGGRTLVGATIWNLLHSKWFLVRREGGGGGLAKLKCPSPVQGPWYVSVSPSG